MYDDWRRLLSERFPERDPDTTRREWEALRGRLAIGQALTGVVVTKAPFGAWLDVGLGFPALIAITGSADLTPERYRADEWCPVGSEVTAFVVGFEEHSIPQVRLSQRLAGPRS
jgi:ribosomal protein S1